MIQSDKIAGVLFPCEQSPNPGAPAEAEKNPELNPALLRGRTLAVAQKCREVASKFGKVFRAPLLPLAIHLARSVPRSNEWWRIRPRRFARPLQDGFAGANFPQSLLANSHAHQRARCDPGKSRAKASPRFSFRLRRSTRRGLLPPKNSNNPVTCSVRPYYRRQADGAIGV